MPLWPLCPQHSLSLPHLLQLPLLHGLMCPHCIHLQLPNPSFLMLLRARQGSGLATALMTKARVRPWHRPLPLSLPNLPLPCLHQMQTWTLRPAVLCGSRRRALSPSSPFMMTLVFLMVRSCMISTRACWHSVKNPTTVFCCST